MSQTPTVGGGPISASINGGTSGASNILKGGDEQLSIKHVTPELAAQVVKHFVLPMFDTVALPAPIDVGTGPIIAHHQCVWAGALSKQPTAIIQYQTPSFL